MAPVTPTGTKSPKEADRAEKAPVVEAAAIAVAIMKTT